MPHLNEADLEADPVLQFGAWLSEARATDGEWVDAMVLSTVDADGQPQARAVLLRGFDRRGLVFFTNFHSRKAEEIESTPRAAAVFLWSELQRQVRVTGRVEKVSDAEADAYWRTRPRGAQVSANASEQSRVIASRAELEQRVAEVYARYEDQVIPRPPHWGGYRIVPDVFEFWQGRADRLHDRIRYTRAAEGWNRERLAP